MDTTPSHIAFIMDGNGRWANAAGKPRVFGHEAGMHKIEQVCGWCKDKGVKYGSFFAFSKENWSRSEEEVSFIFSLIDRYYKQQIDKLMKQGIRFVHIGDKQGMPASTLEILTVLERMTAGNSSFYLLFCFNYSGKDDIIHAASSWADAREKGGDTDLSQYLYTSGYPDPDLLIRTSGEQRISNFFLFQLAYCELYFEQQYWPAYSKAHFEDALAEYAKRNRRFGKA